MKLIGRITSIFTITARGDAIMTDREIGVLSHDHFPVGIPIELRNAAGMTMTLHIRSAELAYKGGKDYLSFILQERIDKVEIEAYDEVWCDAGLVESLPPMQ